MKQVDNVKAQSEETPLPQTPTQAPAPLPPSPSAVLTNAPKPTRKRLFPAKIKAPGPKTRRVLAVYAALLVVTAFAGRAYKQYRLNDELMDAIKAKQSLAVITRLLNEGADANATAYDTQVGGDKTALGIAVECGDIPLASALLDKGADTRTRSSANFGHDADMYPPLSIAAHRDDLNMARFLLERLASVEDTDSFSRTPLTEARSIPMLTLFLKYKADVNSRDWKGFTPLMYAALDAQDESVGFLLQHGADVNAQDDYGNTALFYAKNEAMIRLLLRHGAEVNTQNYPAETALAHAAKAALNREAGSANTRAQAKAKVKFLLLRGADPTLKDNDGESALADVKELGYAGLVKKAQGKARH